MSHTTSCEVSLTKSSETLNDEDSDVEFLCEIANTPPSTQVTLVKSEIKEELDDIPTNTAGDISIKQEYEEKFFSQALQISSQNRKLHSMQKTMNIIVEHLNNANKDDVKNPQNDLVGLSKLIDDKLPSNFLMPESCNIPEETIDEITSSPSSPAFTYCSKEEEEKTPPNHIRPEKSETS